MIVDTIKLRCQISGSQFDKLINGYIEEAQCSLREEGINVSDAEDKLILSAIECYVKAAINYDNRAEWYEKQFEKRKQRLSLDGDYQ